MSYSSHFLSDAYQGNLHTLQDLQFRCQLTNDQTADLCGVSTDTYQRWKRTWKPSVAAVRLLAILAGHVPWDGWDGWEIHQGYLFPPGFTRNGLAPLATSSPGLSASAVLPPNSADALLRWRMKSRH
jgi:hypothetical protein